MRLTEVTTMAGAVLRCRAVPPFVQAEVRMLLPQPPFPKVDITSAAGGTETHDALPGSEEYEAYRFEMRKYRQELTLALSKFYLNYGIVDWKLPGEEEWCSEPPAGWKVPDVMRHYDVATSGDPAELRVQYIQYELIITDTDSALVDAVHLPGSPLTKEEIIAALDPFDSSAVIDLSNILSLARRE